MEFISSFNPDNLKKKLDIIKIEYDISNLTENQKKVINYLIECSKILHEIFLIQNYSDNIKLKEDINSLNNPDINDFFNIMAGPFDHFENDKSYIVGINDLDQAGFYPQDLTREEWDNFISIHPKLKEDYISPYTIIRRENNKLKAIPYSEYYKEYLTKAVDCLNNAIKFADNYSLKSYLQAELNAFVNNDFSEANVRWLQMADNEIVPLLGAYEFYIDKFLGYKAAFTGLISIKNKEETEKIEFILKTLDMLQERLPIPMHYKKQKRGSFSEIEIVNLIYCSGDSRVPIPTIAFNLPNSEKIRSKFGSKKVLLYNIMEAKFNSLILPLSKVLLEKKDQSKVSFAAYFNFVLLHEISHELGIGLIKDNDGKLREPSYFLKDLYTVIEETKADVMGIYSLIFLQKQSFLSNCSFTEICICYFINLIRAIRFGVENSHGLASLIQLNFLIEDEVFIFLKENKKISFDLHKFEKSIEKLLVIILTLQGEGDYYKTNDFINSYSKINEDLKLYMELLKDIPVDILPWFPIALEKKPFSR